MHIHSSIRWINHLIIWILNINYHYFLVYDIVVKFFIQFIYIFFFFFTSVEAAALRSSSFLKPNPYIEFSVDDKSPRKTEVSKSTLQPKWNEEFTVLVTPYSQLHFRLLDHSSFRKDTLIGEKRIYLYDILVHYNGKLDSLELTLDLLSGNKHDYCQTKVGDLVTLFDRLKIDMSTVAPPTHPRPEHANSNSTRQMALPPSSSNSPAVPLGKY